MLVIKFGGTSMGSAENIRHKVIPVIQNRHKTEKELVVVVSAMTGVTNDLLLAAEKAVKGSKLATKRQLEKIRNHHHDAARKMLKKKEWLNEALSYIDDKIDGLYAYLKAVSTVKELSPRSHDIVLAVGEKLSAQMLSCLLNELGIKSSYANMSRVIGNLTYEDQRYWDKVAKVFKKRLWKELDENVVPVVTGFFGPNPGGILSAVGRGYSDFCAALCGAALSAREIEIWTDVDGILSANPTIVPEAKILPEVSFNEAAELSHYGAKVLHPQSIRPALNAHIPIRILNTFNAKSKGTVITHEGKISKHPFKSIAYKKGLTLIRIQSLRMMMHYGFMAKIFEIFKTHKMAPDLMATAESSVSMTVAAAPKQLKNIIRDLKKIGQITVIPNQAVIAVVGEEMKGENYIQGEIFEVLSDNKIKVNMASIDASLINISAVVDEDKTEQAVKCLHKIFL